MRDAVVSQSDIWERIHGEREWGKYPNEDLIRFCARNLYQGHREQKRVLEVGCGTGANLWMLAREGFGTHGIDFSPTAVKRAVSHLAKDRLWADLRCGDVTEIGTVFADRAPFDAVVDVGTFMHLDNEQAARTLAAAHALLKAGGKWFTSECVTDDCWRGPVEDRGYVHFWTLDELRHAFRIFSNVQIERVTRTYENMAHAYSRWIIEATK